MKYLFRLWPLLLLWLLAGCNAFNVGYDYDRTANFSGFRTFNFSPTLKLPVSQLDEQRIKSAVAYQMQARGMQLSDNPELVVDMFLKTKKVTSATEMTTYPFAGPWPYGWGGGFSTSQIDFNSYLNGTLFIDVVDISKKQLIWQGTISKAFEDPANEFGTTPEARTKHIDKMVAKAFTNYPVSSVGGK